MTKAQRTAIAVGCALVAIALLFPPWRVASETGVGAYLGYGFIISSPPPPIPAGDPSLNGFAPPLVLPRRIDVQRLIVEVVAISVMTAGALVVLGKVTGDSSA